MQRSHIVLSAEPSAASQSTILTVGRGLQVLRAFRSETVPLTNAELVRRTRLPKATVSRLTSTLLHLGYLRMAADDRAFELASSAPLIGNVYAHASELLQRTNPFLQALGERLETSATLAIPDGCDMLCIAYRASPRIAIRFGPGHLIPMAMSAVGRAYLSGLPPDERERMLQRLEQAAGPGQWPAMEAGICGSLAELQATGTCAVLGAFNRNTYAVALPVRVGRRKVLMGMSCGRASMQPDLPKERQRIAPVLKQAAAELEALLEDVAGGA